MNFNIPILIEGLAGFIIGSCIIFARTQIAKIFVNYATKNSINYTVTQEKMLFIILWVIGILFIFGGIFQIIRMLTNSGSS